MNAVDVHIRGVASGQIRAGSTVGEALEQLSADIGARALAALVNGREVDLATPLPAPEDGRSLEIEPVLPGTPEGLEVWEGAVRPDDFRCPACGGRLGRDSGP